MFFFLVAGWGEVVWAWIMIFWGKCFEILVQHGNGSAAWCAVGGYFKQFLGYAMVGLFSSGNFYRWKLNVRPLMFCVACVGGGIFGIIQPLR